ncbi:Nn.00g006210.m01.CDS01 [Neocucurbitaria sp. VM-36]
MVPIISIVLVALLALSNQASCAILIPPPDSSTHGYKVAVSHFPLTDAAHKTPHNQAEDRQVMVSMFIPVNMSDCTNECEISYMPPQTARIANGQFLLNATEGVLEKIGYKVCCGTSAAVDASKLPVVVLEPHVDTSRLLYTNLARYMSANGVAVVLLDHPGDTSIVEFPHSDTSSARTMYNSGNVALSNFSPITKWNETITKAVNTRIQDINFVLSQLSSLFLLKQQLPSLRFTSPFNTSSYSIVGHGLGGTVATSLSFSDPRVLFSINLSGTPPLLDHPSSAPIFFFGRSDFRRENDIHWAATWSHLTGLASEFDLNHSGIFDFSDLPIIVELANNEGGMKDVKGKGLGGKGAWANHAVKCFVEGVVKVRVFGDQRAVSDCVGMFHDMVPYDGRRG